MAGSRNGARWKRNPPWVVQSFPDSHKVLLVESGTACPHVGDETSMTTSSRPATRTRSRPVSGIAATRNRLLDEEGVATILALRLFVVAFDSPQSQPQVHSSQEQILNQFEAEGACLLSHTSLEP